MDTRSMLPRGGNRVPRPLLVDLALLYPGIK